MPSNLLAGIHQNHTFYFIYGLRPHTPLPAELPSKVPAAAKFSHEWQLTASEALRFLVGMEQRDAAVQRKMEADVPLDQACANLRNAQARQKVQADKQADLLVRRT
jgi:hypothetical protein